MVDAPGSKFHTTNSHSSRHHWQWSICGSLLPLGPSTLLEFSHLETYSNHRLPGPWTCQSLQSTGINKVSAVRWTCNRLTPFTEVKMCANLLTFTIFPSATRILRAARSRWTKPLLARYCIPKVICCEKLMRILLISELTSCPGLGTMCLTLSMTRTIVLCNIIIATPVNLTWGSL